MEKPKIIQNQDLKWEPHPQLAGVEVSYLVSHRDENMDITCMLVRLPQGAQVPKHTHECDDIIYVLKGKGKIWIEGIGDVPMSEGSFVRVPKGVLHQPHSGEEGMVVYDVFYPFLA
jgi:quercetin dioxygenase-like cupin family protein